MTINAVRTDRTVADPTGAYESMAPVWRRNRAVCNGERQVKQLDVMVDTVSFSNVLIPFSPTMTQRQYDFYKAEAELPGIVAEYSKMLAGGLLRKKPQLSLPEDLPPVVKDWIYNAFGEDDAPLSSFLDSALREELPTGRCWVHVDYPRVDDPDSLEPEALAQLKPYPIILPAESVVNWHKAKDPVTGQFKLVRVVVRRYEEIFTEANEFHPELVDVAYVHELDEEGYYRIRKFQKAGTDNTVTVESGKNKIDYQNRASDFIEVDRIENILMADRRLTFIPIWPLNGSIDVIEPLLTPLIDKEVSLYNKISRRNHLLYGASTFTPVVYTDMPDEDFDKIVASGLGTWLKLGTNDKVDALKTPTDALSDMDRAIAAGIEEMARLGVRMLAPESSQSGVALQLRNASQVAQLGALNMRVSSTMSDIIAFMINWRFGTSLTATDVSFSMSADFNPSPMGETWLTLVSDWYQAGLLPRSVWLQILKQNDIVPSEYDDEIGKQEINDDDLIIAPTEQNALNQQW